MTEFEFEREHYRIMYPAAARPRFLGDGLEREVIDLCERGEEVRVLGVVVRVTDREVALKLSVGVPLRIVLEEQRYLRERHRGSVW